MTDSTPPPFPVQRGNNVWQTAKYLMYHERRATARQQNCNTVCYRSSTRTSNKILSFVFIHFVRSSLSVRHFLLPATWTLLGVGFQETTFKDCHCFWLSYVSIPVFYFSLSSFKEHIYGDFFSLLPFLELPPLKQRIHLQLRRYKEALNAPANNLSNIYLINCYRKYGFSSH